MEESLFNTAELVSFGNYLLSEERAKRIMNTESEIPYVLRAAMVHDADLANWYDIQEYTHELK